MSWRLRRQGGRRPQCSWAIWRSGVRHAAVAGVLCLLVGCGAEPPTEAAAPGATPAPEQAAPAAAPAPTEPASKRAEAALRAQRLFAPAGDNAFELFVQATTEQPGDERARNALQDLVPYAVLHVEQRLAARDRGEAGRVLALLAQAQSDAPALPRLQQALQALSMEPREPLASATMAATAGNTTPPGTRLGTQEEAPQRPDAPADASNIVATPASGAGMSIAEAHRPDSPGPAVTSPVAITTSESGSAARSNPAEPVAASSAPAQGTAPAEALPRILRQVAPRYPPVAGRRGQEGEVEVAFTINPDGRVGDVVVIRSDPPRVFDRAAIAAMEDWRYEAPGRSVRSSRTFAFRMD